jgi:hypothetical protein
VATLAAISLLLTLASMRLVVPAGMRWRRGRTSQAMPSAEGNPVVEDTVS